MIGNLIYDQFLTARDWPFGAALSMVLIAIMLLLLFAQAMAADPGRRGRGQAPCVGCLTLHARCSPVAFLYMPIAVLMALSFNKAGCRPPGPAFRSKWYGKLAANPKILAAALNTLIVALALDRDRDGARHLLALGVETRARPRPGSMR